MPRSYTTNMNHFIQKDGTIADLPKPAARLARYFGSIVEDVTRRPRSYSDFLRNKDCTTNVNCRRRPGHKPCDTQIIAFMDIAPSIIAWHCPSCRDHGFISGWEKGIWDKRKRR